MLINTRVVTGLGLALALVLVLALGACDKSNDTPQVQQAAKPADEGAASSHTGSPNASLAGAKRAAHSTADQIEQHQRDLEKAADEK